MNKIRKAGFTLVELLVVIGILSVLTAVVLVAVNPGRQFAQARDTQRRADVNTISSAIVGFMADPENNGLLPAGITETCTIVNPAPPPDDIPNPDVHVIGNGDAGTPSDPLDDPLDLGALLAPRYVAAMPTDPQGGTVEDTMYTVCVADATARRITVAAPNTELATTTISVTR